MIPIREALDTRAWLTAEHESGGEVVNFRIRLLEFSRIELESVDDNPTLSCRLDANVWRLGLDVINLCKKGIHDVAVGHRIIIVDQDGYEFQVFNDPHLRCSSEYAKKSGMKAFFGTTFPPKIRRSGSYPFELPDDLEELFIGIDDGTLREA